MGTMWQARHIIAMLFLIGSFVHAATEAEDIAIAAIRQRGGQVEQSKDDDGKSWFKVCRLPKTFLNRDVSHLVALKNVYDLSLNGSGVTDIALSKLTTINGLATLDLAATAVSDAGLKQVAQLHDLEVLFMDRTKVTDAGLVHLSKLKKLRALNLNSTPISGSGFAAFKGNKSIDTIFFAQAQLGDKELASMKGLEGLKFLYMGSNARVTDASIPWLIEFPQLRQVSLWETGVTAAGIEKLRLKKPNLSVLSDKAAVGR